MNEPARAVLVIGGHDSSGQAGVEVDRSAVESLDLEARVVVSAWTQQGSMGVTEIGAVDPSLWLAEALSLLDEQVGAVKFGLLPGLAAARAAGSLMQEVAPGLPVVLDPVIAASSGERFLDHAIVEGYCEQLLSLGAIWTPNLPELAELCDVDLGLLESDLEARSAAAERLVAAGARAAGGGPAGVSTGAAQTVLGGGDGDLAAMAAQAKAQAAERERTEAALAAEEERLAKEAARLKAVREAERKRQARFF